MYTFEGGPSDVPSRDLANPRANELLEKSVEEKADFIIQAILEATYTNWRDLPTQKSIKKAQDLKLILFHVNASDIDEVCTLVANDERVVRHFISIYQRDSIHDSIPRSGGTVSPGLVLFVNENHGGLALFVDQSDSNKIKTKVLEPATIEKIIMGKYSALEREVDQLQSQLNQMGITTDTLSPYENLRALIQFAFQSDKHATALKQLIERHNPQTDSLLSDQIASYNKINSLVDI